MGHREASSDKVLEMGVDCRTSDQEPRGWIVCLAPLLTS